MANKLYDEYAIQDIAEAIREQTGGTDTYTVAQMGDGVRSIAGNTNETHESYVKEESLQIINNIANSVGTFKMIFVTDLHNADDDSRLEHANQAIQALCRINDIDCIVFAGDYVRNWTEISKEEAVEDIKHCHKKLKNQIAPTFWLRGNHDTNGYVNERIPKEEIYNLIASKNVDNGVIINESDPYGNYGYVDFTEKKVRVILINTSDNDFMGLKEVSNPANTAELINCHNVSVTQLQWIADNALSFTESGWRVIFVSHLALYYSTGSSPSWYNNHTYTDDNGDTWTCNLSNMSNLIFAYINKTSFTATLNGETVSKDFSVLSHYADIACGINGHQHAFLVNTDEMINYIAVGNACDGAKESADGNIYTKVNNTANDTTFDVIDFDFMNSYAYCWNYGAGYNRAIPFRYTANTIPVTGVLLNETSGTIQVGDNVALVATVEPSTATNKNVIWSSSNKSVAIVKNGVITALSVGDTVITVTTIDGSFAATYLLTVGNESIINLLETVGYDDGYRLSTSSGNLSACTGRVTTGFIQATANDVIRIKGMTFPSALDGTYSICTYNATSHAFISASCLYTGATWSGFTFAFEDDLLTITVADSNSDIAIRICGGATTGADCIVTINQEIPTE